MPNRKSNYTDMDRYRRTRNEQRKRYYQKTAGKYPMRGWTDEEDLMVINHEIADTRLSELIQRSVSAIQSRRCKLKQIGQ